MFSQEFMKFINESNKTDKKYENISKNNTRTISIMYSILKYKNQEK